VKPPSLNPWTDCIDQLPVKVPTFRNLWILSLSHHLPAFLTFQ
jgi:hypothetical protein